MCKIVDASEQHRAAAERAKQPRTETSHIHRDGRDNRNGILCTVMIVEAVALSWIRPGSGEEA